jgi:MFS family permease
MDHYGRRFAGVPAQLIMAISYALAPFWIDLYYPSSSFALLVLASTGCGIGNGLSSGLLMSLAGDLSPVGEDRAKFLALFRTFADGGVLLGPWVSGILAETWSVNVGFRVVAGVALIGALWMGYMIPETRAG